MKLKKLIHHIDSETTVYIISKGRVLAYGQPKEIMEVNTILYMQEYTNKEIHIMDAKVKDISIGAPDYSLRLEVKF